MRSQIDNISSSKKIVYKPQTFSMAKKQPDYSSNISHVVERKILQGTNTEKEITRNPNDVARILWKPASGVDVEAAQHEKSK